MYLPESSVAGKRSPNRQLLEPRWASSYPSAFKYNETFRRISMVDWHSCPAVVGLVVLKLVLIAVIFTAIRSFSRSRNVVQQPLAFLGMQQTRLSSAQSLEVGVSELSTLSGMPRGLKAAEGTPAVTPAPARQGSTDTCATALGIPKVAMMFLSKGELFHEPSWTLWFQTAADLLPVSALRAATVKEDQQCNTERVQLAQQVCAGQRNGGVLQRQHLFSIYVHPLPQFGSFPKDSIFFGREIQNRIQVSWGAHELVLAARNLLAAALEDPLNQKFILLSESGLPLYPPTTIYLQLMSEHKSRLDSCGLGRTDPGRLGLHNAMSYKLKHHWRKSSQWFALTRKHAELVTSDAELLELFKQHCHNAWDTDLGLWRDCFPDEHYMASLIAYSQLGHETDCVGKLVNVDWSTLSIHPVEYTPDEVTHELFQRLRTTDGKVCDSGMAISISAGEFLHVDSANLQGAAQSACRSPGYNTSALTYDCTLFARKFPRATASAAQRLFANCSSGLNIADIDNCVQSTEEPPRQGLNTTPVVRRMLQPMEGVGNSKFSTAGPMEQGGHPALQQAMPEWLEDRV